MLSLRQHSFIFASILLLQAALWQNNLHHKPQLEIVPSVPSAVAVKAIAFGDNQFFFRVLGFYIQNFGDTFGRYTPLKDYDYAKLNRWFKLLDTLDNTSDYMPSMASYYFSQSQHPEDNRYIVDYLRSHAKGRLDKKWWWQAQAVYIASHKLKDQKLALELALPLVHSQNLPLWVNQLAAFIYEQQGEFASALGVMQQIQENIKNIPPSELRYMEYFVKERLGALDKKQKAAERAP